MSKDYLLKGHRKAVQWVAKNAAMLLPNSESEYRRFVVKYKVAQNYCVIPNGIDLEAISAGYERSEQYSGAVICMGRIEDRKNQLRLIGAVNGTNYRLFIHGKYSPNSKGYYDQCVAAAGKNVTLGPHLEKQALYSAYSSAKVHVLPSYFETTGLSSLEAAALGCNIVVTDRGDTRDYFGDDAWYCDPDDETSIREAIDAAYRAPYDTGFRKRILENFTWERAAEKTLQCYQSVFSNEQPMKKEALAG